jgi:hypothetical protein
MLQSTERFSERIQFLIKLRKILEILGVSSLGNYILELKFYR